MPPHDDGNLNRRDLLKSAVAGTVVLGSGLRAEGGESQPDRDLIRRENEKPGATDWQLTRVRVDRHRAADIEGYCSKQSVKAGETIDIMVSTDPPHKFVIEIFRSGYYGGRGARLMTKLGPFPGKAQPVPEMGDKHLFECHWEPTVSLTIPADWPSGVYLGRLTTLEDETGYGYWQSYVIFIVKDDRPADILFQCSDNTWQAYNRWPSHYSVYTHPKGNQGPWADVSFDRPYGRYRGAHPDPQSTGSGEWLCWEFPLAYWLEQQGYDVSYCSNTDMITPDRALKCKSLISVGHDEYWDIRQFYATSALRDAGVNLLFLSANTCCWVTPHRPSWDGRPDRIMFRGGPYGGEQWYANERERLHGPFPCRGPDEGYLLGARNINRVIGSGDWAAARPDHWMFEGTGMKKGESVPGLVGWEVHGDPATDIPGLEIVGTGTALTGGLDAKTWTSTIYPGPKDNFVFNGSTIFWNLGLSSPPGLMLPWFHWSRPHGPDERVQRMTQNLVDRAIG